MDALIADRIGLDFGRGSRVLDVGAGSGKFRDMLHDFPNMTALEVHEPYIERFDLKARYEQVIVGDVLDQPKGSFAYYDLVILGDVLEHIDVGEARALLDCIRYQAPETAVLVAVPYLYEQGAEEGNDFEIHKQPDLTHKVFNERFPGFDCLARDDKYGIYVRDPLGRWRPEEAPDAAHVLIGVPVHDQGNRIQLTMSLWDAQAYHLIGGLAPLSLALSDGCLVEDTRNRLVARMLARPEVSHVLFVDSDQGFERDAIMRLLMHRAQVVAVPIRRRQDELAWNMTPLDADAIRWNGAVMEVAQIGTGLMLIARSCLERMIAELDPPIIRADDGEVYPLLFQQGRKSEDLGFCEKWRAIGGRVWADPHLEVAHVGTKSYRAKLVDHLKSARQV